MAHNQYDDNAKAGGGAGDYLMRLLGLKRDEQPAAPTGAPVWMRQLFYGPRGAERSEYISGIRDGAADYYQRFNPEGERQELSDYKSQTSPAKTAISNKENDGTFGREILAAGNQQLGLPYDLGGDGTSSTDCGKFTQDTYNKVGVALGTRLANEQYEFCKSNGTVFTDISQAKPGDLVFFQNTYGNEPQGTITHVGI